MAVGQVRLNRLDKFFGGMTNDPRDRTPGKFTYISGFDIYNNPNRLVPNTVFNRAFYGMAASSVTLDGTTATFTVSQNHHLLDGQVVTIEGATEPEYNGTFIITLIDGNSFSYQTSGTTTSPATGDITFYAAMKGQVPFGFTTPSETLYVVSGFDEDGAAGDIWYYDNAAGAFIQFASFDGLNPIFGIADHRTYIDVDSITQSDVTATVTTTETHGLVTGDTVRIVGAEQPEYNGTFEVTVTDSSIFTYIMNSAPGVDATGEIELSTQYLIATQYDADANNTYLVRIGTLPNKNNFYTTDRFDTSMLLPGHNSDNPGMLPHIYLDGIMFVGNGGYISSLDNAGAFVATAFTMPEGWSVVSMAEYAEGIAILARSPLIPDSISKVFFWDAVDTTSPYARLTVAATEPYVIRESGNALTVVCVDLTGLLRVFDVPDTSTITEIHRFSDLETSTTDADFPRAVLDTSATRDEDILLFGNGANMYATGRPLGQADSALSISRSVHHTAPAIITSITRSGTVATVVISEDSAVMFELSTGSLVKISGADQDEYNGTFEITLISPTTFTIIVPDTAVTPATTSMEMYARHSFSDDPYITAAATTGDTLWIGTSANTPDTIYGASPLDASGIFFALPQYDDYYVDDAQITSVILDNSMPETPKEWFSLLIDGNLGYSENESNVLVVTPFIETQDGPTEYTLSAANDQTHGAGNASAAVHWEREINLVGRELIIDMSLDATWNTDAYVSSVAVLSRDMNVI